MFEILFYYCLAKFVVVAESNVLIFVAPYPLRREGKPADAGKKIEVSHGIVS